MPGKSMQDDESKTMGKEKPTQYIEKKETSMSHCIMEGRSRKMKKKKTKKNENEKVKTARVRSDLLGRERADPIRSTLAI